MTWDLMESPMPDDEPGWPEIPAWVHISSGLVLYLVGLTGTVACMLAVATHWKYSSGLMDSTGMMTMNFLLANLGMISLQFPFSGTSSLAGRWLFGDWGCQVYSTVGFVLGIGVVLSLGLVVYDFHLKTASQDRKDKSRASRKRYQLLILGQWVLTSLLVVPPTLGVLGRFYYEPFFTACTLDYWHRNYRNYYAYIYLLAVVGYIVPLTIMTKLFLNGVQAVKEAQVKDYDGDSSVLLHYAGLAKLCGMAIVINLVCWGPYAALCIYTTIFDPSTINIYITYLPAFIAKVSPTLNGWAVLAFVPRVRLGFHLLRNQALIAPNITLPELRMPMRALGSKP